MGIELAFIIPLKSAKVSSDWERTQEMLRNTLASVTQQPGCRAIVVCNEPPDVDATIVEANFQVQSLTFEEARNDKMRKCHLGLQHAASFSPKRAMLLDADDLVHREFMKHVSRFDPSFGVIVRHGYRYIIGDKHLRRSFVFHHMSASSIVFPYSQDLGSGPSDFYMTRQDHIKPIEAAFRAQGIPYGYLRFPACVYLRGSNDSMRDNVQLARRNAGTKRTSLRKRIRTYFWKALGRSIGNIQITKKHLEAFPGLAAYADGGSA